MKPHPRYWIVTEARLKLAKCVVDIVVEHDLTALEVLAILNQEAANWLKTSIRQEREEEKPC